jgi:hypothetical protein
MGTEPVAAVVAGPFFVAVFFAAGLPAALRVASTLAGAGFAAALALSAGLAAFDAAGLVEADFVASFLAGVCFEVFEVGFMLPVLSRLLGRAA